MASAIRLKMTPRRRASATAVGTVVALLLVLTSCADDEDDEGASIDDEGASIRVAFVYEDDPSVPGWEHTQAAGVEQLAEELPDAEITQVEGIPEGPGSARTFERLAEDGNDLIFALSFGYGDQVFEVAEQYPDVKFEWAVGFETAENVSTGYGAKHEGWYAAGIAAAHLSPTGQIGYVAPFPIPIIIHDINAFTLGARSVDPDATVQVVWTFDWEDPVQDREAAEALIDNGADFLAQSSGSPSVGDVASSQGLWWSGPDSPGIESFGPETFATASFIQWGPYFVQRTTDVMEDDWESQSYIGTFRDGGADLAIGPNVPPDVVAEVEAAKEALADGTLEPFAGPIRNQDGEVVVESGNIGTPYEEMAAFLVEGIVGEIPEG